MSSAVTVVCPSCQAVLKVTKISLIGKKVACPSCREPVLVAAARPTGNPDRNGSLDDFIPLQEESREGREKAKKTGSPRTAADAADKSQRSPSSQPSTGRKHSSEPASNSNRKGKPSPLANKETISPAESAEFEAMMADTEDELDEFSVPTVKYRPREKRATDSRPVLDPEHDFSPSEFDRKSQSKRREGQPRRQQKTRPASRSRTSPEIASIDESFELAAEQEVAPVKRSPSRRPGIRKSKRSPSKNKMLLIGGGGFVVILIAVVASSVGNRPAGLANRSTSTTTTGGMALAGPGSGPAAAERQDGDDVEEDRAVGGGNDSTATRTASTAPASATAFNALPSSTVAKDGAASGLDGGKKANPEVSLANAQSGFAKSSRTASASNPRLTVVAPFSANTIDNTTFRLAESKERVLVVAFLGVECPLANLYCPRLIELFEKYRGKSVGFIAVNSNVQDTMASVREQSRRQKIPFPVLKDAGNAVADALGARRTPEVFVLDADRHICYRGMIDDQFGYQRRRSEPSQHYLADAIDAVLASREVKVNETPVQGCRIGRVSVPSAVAQTSYYRDVLPILQARCQQCHRKGEIGPFALTSYELARDWGPTIREAVADRRMPPWPADPHVGKFSNDISLRPKEIDTITKWVDEGCPEGSLSDKPLPREFVDGWNIGKPDQVYSMPTKFHVGANGVIPYQNFEVSPVFAKDTWVQGVECRFGNRAVVHHMLVLLDFPKDRSKSQDGLVRGFFAAGAPGSTYFVFPKGYAKKIPKGARLRFQMHYTPNGAPADDQSRFGIVLAKGTPAHELQTFALGKPDILIRAGEADHSEVSTQTVPSDVTLTTLMPHLHVRGKSFTYTAVTPDGRKTVLLSVPKWDFNWQYQYELAKPLTLTKGSKLIVEAHWDNSESNPNNIFPLMDVGFGEQTFDEMFIGYINFVASRSMADATRPRRTHRRG